LDISHSADDDAGVSEGLAKIREIPLLRAGENACSTETKTCIKLAAHGGAGVFACANFASPSFPPALGHASFIAPMGAIVVA
jgi:hypothetical protein